MAEEQVKPFQVLYDYGDVPTLKRFALSDKRVRLALGCFGSGKSSACVMEIIRRAHMQKPGPDGIRRSRWAVIRNCYDDQTEILTEKRGWRLFRDLLPDDKVATLDKDEIVYKLPNGVAVHPYKGEMVGFENEGANFLVTPDHLMYVSKRRTRKKIWGEYEESTAGSIYGSQTVRVRRDAQWNGGDDLGLSKEVFELLGMWFAEGSYGVYNGRYERIVITQCCEDGVWYLQELIAKTGLKFSSSQRPDGGANYILRDRSDLAEKFSSLIRNAGKSIERKVPVEILNAPASHLRAFIDGMVYGDGHTFDGTTRISLGSRALIDDLQEMALKAGYVANVSNGADSTGRPVVINGEIKGHTNGPTHVLTLLGKKKYRPILQINSNMTNHLRGWYKQQYDGLVYCVEMEKVPVYVRRQGKAFWCYRTYNQLKDTTIKTFMDWFPEKVFGVYRVTSHDYVITKFPGVHLEVMFRALDRPDQVSNLLSLEVTGAWFNEAREIDKTIIEAMDGRIGRYPSGRDGGASWYGIIMDTNPPDDESYLYKMFEVVRPPNWEIFKQPSGLSIHAENTLHLPKGYYQNLAQGKDEMYKRIYIHGQYGYTISGKPVFQSYVDNVHVSPHILEPTKGIEVITGWDFGLNPSVVFGQIMPLGQLRILDELTSDGMGVKQFCINQVIPLIRRKYFGMKIVGYGDPAGNSRSQTDESTCFEILHSAEIGLNGIEPAETNVLQARIGAVEDFLNKMFKGEPGFVMSPNCKVLRKAMNGAYHYERESKQMGGEYKDVPVKNFFSHISDALEELCLYTVDRTTRAQREASFLAQLRKRDYQPASHEAGY